MDVTELEGFIRGMLSLQNFPTLLTRSFLGKFPLHGSKALDYTDFCRVADIMKDNGHLTADGLEKILKIKEGMNQRRS